MNYEDESGFVHENGRLVYGPPRSLCIPKPPNSCEVYVTGLPSRFKADEFRTILQRCGLVYEIRVMMDSGSKTRGYAFVLFTRECDALSAYELLNLLYFDRNRLKVFPSWGKNRLFISNIPKELPIELLEGGFQTTFPDMLRFAAYPGDPSENGENNRGFAFIEFPDHDKALQAKKRSTPGRVRMFNCDLRVQWARPRVAMLDRNINSSDCKDHPGFIYSRSVQQKLAPIDYCAQLRMYCLANNWCIPIVVYGNCFVEYGIQYGGILLKNACNGAFCLIVMEIDVECVHDVHELMCEIAVHLIERDRGFPHMQYLMRSNGQKADILDSFITLLPDNQFSIFEEYVVNASALYDVARHLRLLAQYSSEAILTFYKNGLLCARDSFPMFQLTNSDVCFGVIFPKFRNNPPLNNNFNDIEINLLQLDIDPNTILNCNTLPSSAEYVRKASFTIRSQTNTRLGYVLRYVNYDGLRYRSFYHPAHRVNFNPIFISGHTYQRCIYN